MPADAAKAAGLLFLVVVVQLSVMANVDILAALLPTVLLNLILTIPVYALTRRLLRPPERLTREVRLLG